MATAKLLATLAGKVFDADAFDAGFYGADDKKQTELFRLHCQVSWAVIALCVLKKDITAAVVSQFNGLLRDAHSQGKSFLSNNDPSYFWSIYLHKRAEKVLGLDEVKDED